MLGFWDRRPPVSLRVIVEGPVDEVLRAVRKMGRPKLGYQARLSARIIRSSDRRKYEEHSFPVVEKGKIAEARDVLHRLSRQCLIEPDIEKQVDNALEELAQLTIEGIDYDFDWYS